MRLAYWDNYKGLAIIAVIMIHVSGQTSKFSIDSWQYDFGIVFRQFVNFAVAVFFFISGYFSVRSAGYPIIHYYVKRIFRLLLPYLVWSAVYLVVRWDWDGPLQVIKSLISGRSVSVGYFVRGCPS